MHCESVKPGVDCTFMTKKGCSFNGGKCKTVVEACDRLRPDLGFHDGNQTSAPLFRIPRPNGAGVPVIWPLM